MGVVLCRDDQAEEEEMFANEVTTQAFDDFLRTIGEEVELEGFRGYRGQLSVTSKQCLFVSLLSLLFVCLLDRACISWLW